MASQEHPPCPGSGWSVSPLFAAGTPWRAAGGKIQPNYNPAVQGEMLQAGGGERHVSLPSAARASPLRAVPRGDALLFSSRERAPPLKHHLLAAPVVALHHVGALVVGGWKGLGSDAGLVAHLAVRVGGLGHAQAHAHPLVAGVGLVRDTLALHQLGWIVADGRIFVLALGGSHVHGAERQEVLQVLVAVAGWDGGPLVALVQREGKAPVKSDWLRICRWRGRRGERRVGGGRRRPLNDFVVGIFLDV